MKGLVNKNDHLDARASPTSSVRNSIGILLEHPGRTQ